MLKKLFGKRPENKAVDPVAAPMHVDETAPEQSILRAIRERLLPLGFEETKGLEYPESDFKRRTSWVRWTINLKNEHFVFILKDQEQELATLTSPWYIERNEKSWSEFGDQVLKTLDDWLKTI
jgi:hypothetical protein